MYAVVARLCRADLVTAGRAAVPDEGTAAGATPALGDPALVVKSLVVFAALFVVMRECATSRS